MLQNLKVTKYRNGDAIPNVTTVGDWTTLTTGAYYWNNNDAANKKTYGALYSWQAVSDSRNIAPKGRHVASNAEWTVLTTIVEGEETAGGKLEEAGLIHWGYPNAEATNSSGFTALPGDYCY